MKILIVILNHLYKHYVILNYQLISDKFMVFIEQFKEWKGKLNKGVINYFKMS
jgi:hypothetical protein